MGQLESLVPLSRSYGLQGGLQGRMDGGDGQDEPRHDHPLHVPVGAAVGDLGCIEREAEIPVSEILDFGQSRAENIRHDGRFDQYDFGKHASLPSPSCRSFAVYPFGNARVPKVPMYGIDIEASRSLPRVVNASLTVIGGAS